MFRCRAFIQARIVFLRPMHTCTFNGNGQSNGAGEKHGTDYCDGLGRHTGIDPNPILN
jgi:hypothetical protein